MLRPPSLQTAKMKFAFRGLLWFHAIVMCLFLGLCFLDCPLLALNLPRRLVTVADALLSIVIIDATNVLLPCLLCFCSVHACRPSTSMLFT
jgi:hypothetical protein